MDANSIISRDLGIDAQSATILTSAKSVKTLFPIPIPSSKSNTPIKLLSKSSAFSTTKINRQKLMDKDWICQISTTLSARESISSNNLSIKTKLLKQPLMNHPNNHKKLKKNLNQKYSLKYKPNHNLKSRLKFSLFLLKLKLKSQ